MKGKLEITKFFGLSRAGKSFCRDLFIKENYPLKNYKDLPTPSQIEKIYYFLKYLLKNPFSTSILFYQLNKNIFEKRADFPFFRIFFHRNSYLLGSLLKSERVEKFSGKIMIEDYSIQSLFMIYFGKAKRKDIKKTIRLLKIPDRIFIFEVDEKTRLKRLRETRFPAEKVNKKYAKIWAENFKYNFNLIKKELLSFYSEDKKQLSNIKKNFKELFTLKKVLVKN